MNGKSSVPRRAVRAASGSKDTTARTGTGTLPTGGAQASWKKRSLSAPERFQAVGYKGRMESTKKHGDGKQPDGPFFAPQPADDLSSHLLRQALGYLGFWLPALVYVVARWRPVGESPGWTPLDSISEYYYSGSIAVLVGALWAMAAFLFTYRGFDNPSHRWDLIIGKVASIAALGVSLFPTTALDPFIAPVWWRGWMEWVHLASAAVLFGCFVVYSLFLFPKSSRPKENRDSEKHTRNAVYYSCGVGIALALLWVVIARLMSGHIFFPESLALVLFGISWLTKGRALWTLRQVAHRFARRKDGAPSLGPSPGA